MKKISVFCLLCKDAKVLLFFKKYGLDEGMWSIFERELIKDEDCKDMESFIKQSFKEDVGVEPLDLEKTGILEFEFHGNPDLNEVHIFKAKDFKGQLFETDQFRPEWFLKKYIPFGNMWQDSKYWIPFLLDNKKFIGKFLFDENQNIIGQNLMGVDEFKF